MHDRDLPPLAVSSFARDPTVRGLGGNGSTNILVAAMPQTHGVQTLLSTPWKTTGPQLQALRFADVTTRFA